MGRRMRGDKRGVNTNGPSASEAKGEGTLSFRRVGQQKSSSGGPTNGWSEDHAEGQDHFHQLIAERAYVLYERSGFQDGKDLEHWLEAERQVKAVRGLAA